MVHGHWIPASAGMTHRAKLSIKCHIIGQPRNISYKKKYSNLPGKTNKYLGNSIECR